MHRRQFVQAFASVLVVFGAGCSFQQEQSTELSIVEIEIENLAAEDAIFTVGVRSEGETVFESSQPVSANDAVVIEQPADKPGDYTLEITTPEQTATQNLTLFADEGHSCVLPVVRLDQGGVLHIEGKGYSRCSS